MENYIWKMILHGGPARQPFFHPKHKTTSMLNEKKESMWCDRFAWNFNPSHSNLITHQRAFTGRPRLWIKPKTLVDKISAVSDLRILKVKWRHINTNRNTFLIAIPRFKKKKKLPMSAKRDEHWHQHCHIRNLWISDIPQPLEWERCSSLNYFALQIVWMIKFDQYVWSLCHFFHTSLPSHKVIDIFEHNRSFSNSFSGGWWTFPESTCS